MQSASLSDGKKTSQPSLVSYALLALGVALFVRFFIAAPYVVSGASMEPTFNNWDYLITDRLSYRLSGPARGDVVIFKMPDGSGKTLIKRVVGLPGERVAANVGGVRIVNDANPEGFILSEPYLDPEKIDSSLSNEVTLGEHEYFVLGDNREVSADSRIWGALHDSNIVGRVLVRLFPFGAADIFPGKATYDID